MLDFKNILYPIDFSDCSEKSFPWALNMARKFEAKLHLLFVARNLSYFRIINVSAAKLDDIAGEIAGAGEVKMKEFCDKYLANYPNYETKVVIGEAETEILKYADEKAIELIVLSTHGRKGLERTLLGSVADRVIKKAKTPLLIINPFRCAVYQI
ncbi:MAG: universal stress protein [Desulfobacterales bacterium]|nr:universal stress protein [Desulfobacterales bacterium]